jgi:choice-of-anchor A domain-containing protein
MDFNVISFNNFTANTGDIEGRLAVRGKVTVGKGWSVGYQLQTTNKDHSLPFALVAGGDVTFPSGAIYPDGSNRPYPGTVENMFVGGAFSGASYLATRKTGTCSTAGCLDTYFGAAQTCYNALSTGIAANADNTKKNIVWSTMYVNCTDPAATSYYLSLLPSEISSYTAVSVDMDNCNNHARWYVNIRGTTDVTFAGNQDLPANAAGVVYNVIGSGRKVNVKTGIRGHLIAPQNNVIQTNGVIVGKLVANNIQASLQINKNQCYVPSLPDASS